VYLFGGQESKKVTFVYLMTDKSETATSPTATVRWFGTVRVEIETDGNR